MGCGHKQEVDSGVSRWKYLLLNFLCMTAKLLGIVKNTLLFIICTERQMLVICIFIDKKNVLYKEYNDLNVCRRINLNI